MNWYENRHDEEFIYKRLSWDNWIENLTYNYITSGSIEYANDSDLKCTGKFNFTGYELPNENDLIRVYYRFKDDSGESQETALATFFASFSSITYTDTIGGLLATGTLNAESILSVLKNKKLGYPLTCKRGANAVEKARQLCEECNLRIHVYPSSFNLTSDYTFKESDNYLTIVNTLLDMAGYTKAFPDANGIIHLEPKNYDTETITFINNNQSIMYPEVENSNNYAETPNVVKLFFNTDTYSALATASNISGSRASLTNRGNREYTYVESVSNVGNGNISKLLRKRAEEVLKNKSADIEFVKWQHAYIPMKLNDTININYGDFIWSGYMDNYSIDLSPSVKTTSKAKRELSQAITIESSVQIFRGE